MFLKYVNIELTRKIIRTYVDLDGKKTIYVDKGVYTFTPDLLKGDYKIEDTPIRLTLYPYGACKIRETVFKMKK